MSVTAEAIRKAIEEQESNVEEVRVEGLSTPVYFRKMSGEDHWRLIVLQAALTKAGMKVIPPKVLTVALMVDADGAYVYQDADLSDGARHLSKLRKEVLNALYEHAARITGLGPGALEEAEKKSSSSQSSDSGTSSPS